MSSKSPRSAAGLTPFDKKRRRISTRLSQHCHSDDTAPGPQMPYYDDVVIRQMAERLDVDIPCVVRHLPALNAAATWLSLNVRAVVQNSPSKRVRLLKSAVTQTKQLRKSLLDTEKRARRLLRVCGIERSEEAEDGPQLEALAVALEIVTQPDEVRTWLTTVAGMMTAASKAAGLFDASGSSEDAAVRQAVRRGVGPNCSWAEHVWLHRILALYDSMTGRGRATSVYPGGDRSGEAHGPLIDFIQLAAQPLGIAHDKDAWRATRRM